MKWPRLRPKQPLIRSTSSAARRPMRTRLIVEPLEERALLASNLLELVRELALQRARSNLGPSNAVVQQLRSQQSARSPRSDLARFADEVFGSGGRDDLSEALSRLQRDLQSPRRLPSFAERQREFAQQVIDLRGGGSDLTFPVAETPTTSTGPPTIPRQKNPSPLIPPIVPKDPDTGGPVVDPPKDPDIPDTPPAGLFIYYAEYRYVGNVSYGFRTDEFDNIPALNEEIDEIIRLNRLGDDPRFYISDFQIYSRLKDLPFVPGTLIDKRIP